MKWNVEPNASLHVFRGIIQVFKVGFFPIWQLIKVVTLCSKIKYDYIQIFMCDTVGPI